MKVDASTGDPFSGKRAVDIKIVAPGSVYNGRLTNPDPIIAKHGSWEGICKYDSMERQCAPYAGIVSLFADKVCAIDRTWKAGDESVGKSRELRDLIATQYKKIPDLHILNKKMVKGRFPGFAAMGKSDWRIDEETKILVPHDVYDIPQRYIKFTPNGRPLRVTAHASQGEEIPDEMPRRDRTHGAMFFFRWGSRWTPYGEGDAQYCFLPVWHIQTARQIGLANLEMLGRAVPWVEVPATIGPDDLSALESGVAKLHKYYVLVKTDTMEMRVTYPNQSVVSAGAAGKSEMEYLKHFIGEIYICVLGVQMTQESSGGSRALESARLEVISDKTPPASQALDQAWTQGWSNHIWEVNEPNVPQALWPKCESDASSASATLNGAQITAIVDIGAAIVRREMTATYAEKAIQGAGLPETWAKEMVKSMVEERDSLATPDRTGSAGRVNEAAAMDAADRIERVTSRAIEVMQQMAA